MASDFPFCERCGATDGIASFRQDGNMVFCVDSNGEVCERRQDAQAPEGMNLPAHSPEYRCEAGACERPPLRCVAPADFPEEADYTSLCRICDKLYRRAVAALDLNRRIKLSRIKQCAVDGKEGFVGDEGSVLVEITEPNTSLEGGESPFTAKNLFLCGNCWPTVRKTYQQEIGPLRRSVFSPRHAPILTARATTCSRITKGTVAGSAAARTSSRRIEL